MGKHLLQKEKTENKTKTPKLKLSKNEVQEPVPEAPKKEFVNHRHKSRGQGIASLAISALVLIAIQFSPFEGWMLKAAYAIALLIAALELIWDMLDNIMSGEYFASENAALLAAIVSFCIGLELEAVLILLLFRIAKFVLSKLDSASRDMLKDFSRIVPQTANVETSEGLLKVDPDYVNVGDIITVEAGEMVPLDGVIVEGISTIDTSAVSGQSSPWAVNEGHRVYSGCRNITSPLRVRVTKPAEQSTAYRLVKLAESSTEYFSRQEKFAAGINRYYTAALAATALVLVVTLSLVNGEWRENAERAVILLVAACSSTGLASIALAYIRSIGIAAERGVFAKGSDCIESMAKSETMVFDKTGIITEGRYIITDVFPNNVSEQELLTMAATAERFSRHPIAIALRDAAGSLDIDYRSLQIEEIPGRGVSAFVGEKQVYVGNTALLEEHGIKCAIPKRSGAAIHVAVDYKYWGHILITDRIRRGAFDALENLRAYGVKKMVLLTGDVLSVAKPLASKLNFDMLRAELKPSDKVSAVEFLMANRGDSSALAFVGDGNSDEHIMSRVDVGIAMGALGSDAALSAADVLIMDRDIKKLPGAVSLSRLTYRVALENILLWLLVNILLIVLGALGVLPVLAAIIAQFVLVCAVLLNLLRIK